MKKLKRIIALCLSLSILSATIALADELSQTMTDDMPLKLLNALEITDYTASSRNKELTRGEFAEMVVRMMGYGNETIKNYNTEPYFTDVAIKDENFNAIGIAAENGWITGFENGRYYPDGKIKSQHAIHVMLRCLGYGEFIEAFGISGITNEITKNTKLSANLDMYSAFVIMYNTLRANTFGVNVLSSEKVSYTESETDLLWELYEVRETEGIVNANDLCGLYGYSKQTQNCVLIGENDYYAGETDISDYIGYWTEVFVRGEDDGEVIAFSVSDRNEVVAVKAEDISADTTDRRLVYFDENEKERYVNIPLVDMIYNDELLSGYSEKELEIKNGTVTVIDNDRDGDYEVVVVKAYTNYVVNNVSPVMETIDFMYGQSEIDYSDGKYLLCDIDGIEMSFSSLKKYDVLAVYESKTGKAEKIKLVKSDIEPVLGKISGVHHDDEKTYIEIDSAEYCVESTYYDYSVKNSEKAPVPVLGLESTFYFDIDGRIAAISKEIEEGLLYGYMTRLYMNDESDEEELCIKIFTQSGEYVTLTADEKIRYNGDRAEFNEILDKTELYKTYPDGKTKIKPQLIKYKVVNGQVKEMYTAEDKGELTVAENGESVNYVCRSVGNILVKEGSTFNKYFFDNDTKVFSVPADDGTVPEEDEMFVYSTNVIKGDTKYWMTFYDVDETGKISVIMMNEAADPEWTGANIMVVESITTELNTDDEAMQAISGTDRDGVVQKYYVSVEEGLIEAANIQKGDIVAVIADNKNEVQSLRKLFTTISRKDDKQTDDNFKNHVAYAGIYTIQQAYVVAGADTTYDYFSFGSVYGKTCGKTASHVIVNSHSKDDNGEEYAKYTYPLANWHTQNVTFIDYRNRDVSVYTGSYADIKETGDEVFAVVYHYRPGAIYVIKR